MIVFYNGVKQMEMSTNPFKIDENVAIPPRKPFGRPRKYLWDEMKVNDSVAFPLEGDWPAAKVSAAKFFREKGWAMTTRELGKFGRIWRIS